MPTAPETPREEMGALLRSTRLERRPELNMKQFAQTVGLHPDSISNIETGHKWPSPDLVHEYERVCDLPGDSLVQRLDQLRPLTLLPQARITFPDHDATVCHRQEVHGTWSGRFADHQLWIVVRPALTDRYYVQPGPITRCGTGTNGTWTAIAFLGMSSTHNIAEHFNLIAVVASVQATPTLAASLTPGSKPGWVTLPRGTARLDAIAVRRGPC